MSSHENQTAEIRDARGVVLALLERTELARHVLESSLDVTVGEGNWISYDFLLAPGAISATSELPRVANASAEALKQSPKRGEPDWFRSTGKPSLHFRVESPESASESFRIVGHVDAAHPTTHPLSHLLHDYLPARGFGKHPTPAELLNRLRNR